MMSGQRCFERGLCNKKAESYYFYLFVFWLTLCWGPAFLWRWWGWRSTSWTGLAATFEMSHLFRSPKSFLLASKCRRFFRRFEGWVHHRRNMNSRRLFRPRFDIEDFRQSNPEIKKRSGLREVCSSGFSLAALIFLIRPPPELLLVLGPLERWRDAYTWLGPEM